MWLGDAVYPSSKTIAPVAQLREEYEQLKYNRSLGYADFIARSVPIVYGTVDDHDYGGNDMGKHMPDKLARAAAFWDFLGHLPPKDQGTGSGTRQGVYASVLWGMGNQQVKVILLDTRWHRDDHCLPSPATTRLPFGAAIACLMRWLDAGLLLSTYFPSIFCRRTGTGTVLGEEQWKWLHEQLAGSTADVHVIVSGVQVLSTNPAMENWGHFPAEREKLMRLLAETVPSGVIVLSGDVHHAEILSPVGSRSARGDRDDNRNNRNTFLEVTSSSLTHDCSQPVYGRLCQPLLETFHRHRYDSNSNESSSKPNYYIGRNYGTIELDWQRKRYQVRIHDTAGTVVLSTGQWPFAQSPLTAQDIRTMAAVQDGHLIRPVLVSVAVIAFTHAILVCIFLFRNRKTVNKR